MQTKLQSLHESAINTFGGLVVSLLITMLVNYYLAAKLGVFWTSVTTVGLCTIWSLLRNFGLRRYFNQVDANPYSDYRLLRTMGTAGVAAIVFCLSWLVGTKWGYSSNLRVCVFGSLVAALVAAAVTYVLTKPKKGGVAPSVEGA